MAGKQQDQRLAFTVTWEVRAGEEDAAAGIITRFVPLARQEDGLELLMVHRNADDPAKFLFYEVFRDAAAFEAHQQTAHFKTMIMEEALPKLAKRERVWYSVL